MRGPDDPNPILTPAEMAKDARISKATWHRRWRYDPRVVKALIRLSPRRHGMRQRKWRAILAEGVRPKDGQR